VMTEEETEVRRAKRTWPAQYKLDILNEIDDAKPRSTDLPVVSGFLRALNGFLVPERAWLLRGRVEAGLVSLLGW
jgi:hypothetical protein